MISHNELKRFVESDDWKEVIASTRQGLKDQWADEKSGASRERLWHTLNAIPEIERAIRRTINNAVRETKQSG